MILFFPFDLLSHYLRCLELAATIPDHQILFPASKNYQNVVEEMGFATFPYQGISSSLVMEEADHFNFSWLREELLEEAFLEQVRILKEWQPSVVVGDANFTLRLAAAYCKVPYISLVNGYMSEYYAIPRRLPQGHWISSVFSFVPTSWFNAISHKAEGVVMQWLDRPFQKLARKYGVLAKRHLLQELQGDLTLLLDLPPLFPQRPLPSHHQIIGPMTHRSQKKEESLLEWLQEGPKTIFVSAGSTGDISKFLFLADEKYQAFQILVAGKKASSLQAPHIFSQEFIHVDSLLPRIDLFICHGGNGTIYQALLAGIPVLCSPSNFEQEWNLQGLEQTGWGERLRDTSSVMDQIHFWLKIKDSEKWRQKRPSIHIDSTKRLFKEKVEGITSGDRLVSNGQANKN